MMREKVKVIRTVAQGLRQAGQMLADQMPELRGQKTAPYGRFGSAGAAGPGARGKLSDAMPPRQCRAATWASKSGQIGPPRPFSRLTDTTGTTGMSWNSCMGASSVIAPSNSGCAESGREGICPARCRTQDM